MTLTKIIDIFLLFIFIVLFVIVPKGANSVLMWSSLMVFYYYIIQTLSSRKIIFSDIKTYFKIETFFLIFFYLLYYFPYQSHLLGWSNVFDIRINSSSYFDYTNISIVTSTIGLIAFMIGIKSYRLPKRGVKIKEIRFFSKYYSNIVMSLLSIMAITVFILYWRTGGLIDLLFQSYTSLERENVTANGLYALMTLIVTVMIGLVLLYRLQFKRFHIFSWITLSIVILWSFILLIIGNRNGFFNIAIIGVGGYYILFKEIGLLKLFGIAFFAYLLFLIVGMTRGLQNKSIENISETISEFKMSETSVAEGAFSITNITTRAAFAVVKEKHGFFYGKFTGIGIAGIIPYSRQLLVKKDDPYISSSKVLGREMLGPNASWGVGSNIISHLYLDFGIPGVVVFMWFLGWFGTRVTKNVITHKTNYLSWIIFLIVLSNYAELPRYTLTFPLRNILWTYILFKIIELIFNHKSVKLD